MDVGVCVCVCPGHGRDGCIHFLSLSSSTLLLHALTTMILVPSCLGTRALAARRGDLLSFRAPLPGWASLGWSTVPRYTLALVLVWGEVERPARRGEPSSPHQSVLLPDARMLGSAKGRQPEKAEYSVRIRAWPCSLHPPPTSIG